MNKVGCEDDEGLLIIHDENETCEVCKSLSKADLPRGRPMFSLLDKTYGWDMYMEAMDAINREFA